MLRNTVDVDMIASMSRMTVKEPRVAKICFSYWGGNLWRSVNGGMGIASWGMVEVGGRYPRKRETCKGSLVRRPCSDLQRRRTVLARCGGRFCREVVDDGALSVSAIGENVESAPEWPDSADGRSDAMLGARESTGDNIVSGRRNWQMTAVRVIRNGIECRHRIANLYVTE